MIKNLGDMEATIVTLEIEYFKDGVIWKPKYDITSAVSFFKKVAELKHEHRKFSIKELDI